jgi:hypothetical protein
MATASALPERPGASPREVGAWLLGIGAIAAAQIGVTGAAALVRRPLWLDEVHTHLLVHDSDLGHAMRALADGADANAPLLYLVLRAVRGLVGAAGPEVLRVFALLCTLGALTATYATLRLAVGRAPAAVGALSLWAHPLVVRHAFEARFYAPWLLLLASLAFVLTRTLTRSYGRGTLAAIALLSIATCTIHYLGLASWALLAGGWMLAARGHLRSRWIIAALGIGPIALLACLPLYLGQQRALAGVTWIPEPTPQHFVKFVGGVFPATLIVPIAVVVVVAWFIQRRGSGGDPQRPERVRRLTPLIALAAIPLLFTLFSYGVQSLFMPRYGMPALLSIAACVALVVEAVPPLARALLAAVWVALSSGSLAGFVAHEASANQQSRPIVDAVTSNHEQVVFENRLDLFPLLVSLPDQARRFHFLGVDVPRSERLRFCEQRVAAALARHYPIVRIQPAATLRSLAPVVLIAEDDDATRVRRAYAMDTKRLHPRVFRLSAQRP